MPIKTCGPCFMKSNHSGVHRPFLNTKTIKLTLLFFFKKLQNLFKKSSNNWVSWRLPHITSVIFFLEKNPIHECSWPSLVPKFSAKAQLFIAAKISGITLTMQVFVVSECSRFPASFARCFGQKFILSKHRGY